MRNWYLLILLVFIFGCNNQKSQPTANKKDTSTTKDSVPVTANQEAGQSELYILEPASKTEFEQAATRHQVSFMMGPEEARKVNGVLVLKINDKWTPIEAFRDTLLNENDPEIREYRYLGQNQQLNQYLVAGSFYEGFETYLVDKTTGKITPTWTEPSVSPDQKY
ncbi:MAG: hypothetical protein M3Q05_06730, partial [Bacteroidota bacterium]|nr:hypothetical protein [Bacteroidota bacterium]